MASFPAPQPRRQAPTSEAEEEDGLGFYDDGVKRTLTDEQIALLRHSEIQRLLRGRRLKVQMADDLEEVRVGHHEPDLPLSPLTSNDVFSPSRMATNQIPNDTEEQDQSRRSRKLRLFSAHMGSKTASAAPNDDEECKYEQYSTRLSINDGHRGIRYTEGSNHSQDGVRQGDSPPPATTDHNFMWPKLG